jgi:universal stress protein F
MNTILVALDGSERAPRVLETGVQMARSRQARLVVMRAIGVPSDVPQDFFKVTDEPLIEVFRRNAVVYLESCLRAVPPDLRASDALLVVVGVPWDGICRAAEKVGADLVVIGSHGYGGLDRVLGTTAAKVVNHLHCSVLVVREPHDASTDSSGNARRA